MSSIGAALITDDFGFESLKNLLPQLTKFDQVIIAHNGKDKRAREYIRQLGKPFEYYRFNWRPTCRDEKGELYPLNEWGFSYARNFSFSKLTTDYALWLDTDDHVGLLRDGKEVLSNADQTYRAFKKIITEAPEDIDVWFSNYVYSRDNHGNPNTLLARERLVKMSAGWKWIYPVHEVLIPSREPKHAIISDVQTIHHPPLKEESSLDRNTKMLDDWYDQLMNYPDEVIVRHDLARCRWYIGENHWAAQRYREAVHWLVKEFAGNHPEALDLEKLQAWNIVGKCQIELNNFEAARLAALQSIDIEPSMADGYITLAQVKLIVDEDPQDILALLDHAGHCQEPPAQVIQNPLDYTFTPYCIVSECKYRLGQYDSALEWAKKAYALAPSDERTEKLVYQASTRIRERDAAEAAKALYRLLFDYEENEKAARLYELLPYVAQKNAEVIEAAQKSEKRIKHLTDKNEYAKMYSANPNWVPGRDEWIEDNMAPGQERFDYILGRLRNALPNGGRVLDVGCSDGFHSLLFAKHGYEVVGIDLDKRCVDMANERAERYGLNAKFVHALFEDIDPERVGWFHYFDAVVCAEVIEHVKNPEFLIGALGDCAKNGAPIILTTPDGAWDKGNNPASYDSEDPSPHVRAFTQETFERLLTSPGLAQEFHVMESHFVRLNSEQGWQVGEIRRTAHPEGPVIRIWCGDNVEFSPDDLNTKGMGGSETAVVSMAKEWAKLGCQVVAYTGINGVWDGVFYRDNDHFSPQHKSDIFISWRIPAAFLEERPNAETTVLWCHDLYYPAKFPGLPSNHYPEEWLNRVDYIVALSEFHKSYLVKCHPNWIEKVWVTRNGIDPTRYMGRNIEKVPHRYFYSSSYDRGLEELLDVWPDIKKAIPRAELHVCYGTDTVSAIAKRTGDTKRLKELQEVEARLSSMRGVIHHSRIGQQELADLQLSCEAWLYPLQPNYPGDVGGFLETYGITAIEAQAARCYPVTRLNGALPEVVKNPVAWTEDTDIVQVLKQIDSSTNLLDTNQEWALSQSWESLAKQWVKQFAPAEELVEVG